MLYLPTGVASPDVGFRTIEIYVVRQVESVVQAGVLVLLYFVDWQVQVFGLHVATG